MTTFPARFFAADLAQLAPADLIETVDFEAIVAELKAYVAERLPIDTLALESEPVTIVLEAIAYREMLLRALVNDKARSVLLAYATGADLDHLGALMATARRVIGFDEDENPIFQTDAEYREEIQLAPEAFSVAGPEGAYVYFARRAHGSICDAAALNPHTNRIDVVVLGRDGDGSPSAAAKTAVINALSPKTVRPLDDDVHVRGPQILTVPVEIRLDIRPGPDPAVLRDKASAAIATHIAGRRRIGLALRVDGLIGAARTAGDIERVVVLSPSADAEPGAYGVVHVPTTTVTTAVLE